MPEDGKSYADYAQNLSNVMNGMFFFAGFTFTVVAILLTSLPNPRSIQSQFTLLLLTAIFYLTVYIAFDFMISVTFYVDMPPLRESGSITNVLVLLTFLLIGLAFPLLFLLWNLTSVAAISGSIWLVYSFSISLFVFRPFLKWRMKRSRSSKNQE